MEKKEKEDLLKDVEETVKKGMRDENLKRFLLTRVIPVVVVVALLLCGYFFLIKKKNDVKDQLKQGAAADSHDLVLDDDGLRGYTSADFAEAVLGDTEQLKKVEVYQAQVSDAVTLTDTGLLNFKIFNKSQVLTYNGTVVYTVDLAKLNKASIDYDEQNKVVTMYIPKPEREEINIPADKIQYNDPEKGLLALGDINIKPEDITKLENGAREKMEAKLTETGQDEYANRFAKMTIWEMYQPLISKLAPSVKLEVEFL
ncbi:MAG: DUF4230 domain-containing protein [Lachnospiraceae bacterium]|nr:DUF4230 domain-containing protein [Lachnospiraceae bacterium]